MCSCWKNSLWNLQRYHLQFVLVCVHQLQTIANPCFYPQPTVKLLSVSDSDKGFHANLTCFLVTFPNLPIPFRILLIVCCLIFPLFYAHPFLSFSISPHLSQPHTCPPFSLSPPQAHQHPQWCCSLLTRLPPSPQVRPLPLPASSSSSTSCSIFNSTIQDLFSWFSLANPNPHLCQQLSVILAKC